MRETKVQAAVPTRSEPIVPPAPKVHDKDLAAWRVVRDFPRDTLSTWPDYAFDVPINRRRIFGIDGVLINDPEGVRHVMATAARKYARPVAFVRIFRPLAGNGLILAEGAEWRAQRRMLAPVFTPASVGRLLPHFQRAAEDLVRRLEGQSTANLAAAFQDATLEAVLRALFTLADADQRQRLAGMVRAYMAGPGRPQILDGFSRMENSWSWTQRGRRAFQRAWFAAVDEIVAERKAQGASDHPADLLDLLLAARDAETGQRLSDAEVRDQCATMLLAGFETTSRLLFWASYLLCLDQTEQSQLRAQISAFPPERAHSLDDLRRWPVVRETLLETLRLYPSAPVLTREAVEPDTILGVDIKPGAQIFISPWVIHRHRKYWEQPNAFIPSRFKDKPSPWTSGTFMPFGAGPRICIGAAFAMAEAEIMLATLLSRFRISLADTTPVLPVGRITTMPSYEPQFQLERI
jgi:cytochrome P450